MVEVVPPFPPLGMGAGLENIGSNRSWCAPSQSRISVHSISQSHSHGRVNIHSILLFIQILNVFMFLF